VEESAKITAQDMGRDSFFKEKWLTLQNTILLFLT
jgi:hypothetical protein